MNDTYVALMIAVIAGITLLMRIIPFLIFGNRKTPAYIEFLGKYLPYSIMGMLVVYCLKGISFVNTPFGIPELVAVLFVAVLYIWKRNTLLSIVSGTACYMVLIRLSA